MCLAVYLASSVPIPMIEWDDNRPALSISGLTDHEMNVTRHFHNPHIYYVGSHTGCGCGFLKEGGDEEDIRKANEDYRALAKIIREVLASGGEVELFSCWEGDQAANPDLAHIESHVILENEAFEFNEKEYIQIRK